MDARDQLIAELVAACGDALQFLPKGEYAIAGSLSHAVLVRDRVRAVVAKGKAHLSQSALVPTTPATAEDDLANWGHPGR